MKCECMDDHIRVWVFLKAETHEEFKLLMRLKETAKPKLLESGGGDGLTICISPGPEIVGCEAAENEASITDLRTGKVYPAAM